MKLDKIKTTAFTLIELLVVIAIIGILSGLIIVGMSSATQSATIAKAQIFSSSLRDSLIMNLVSEWKFDQVISNQTLDSWSGGNTCTLSDIGNGGVCTTTYCPQLQTTRCLYENCLSFNGTGAYLNCGSGTTLNIANTITVDVWVYKTSFANPTYDERVLSKRISGDATDFILSKYGGVGLNQNYMSFYVALNSAYVIVVDTVNIPLNQWVNYVGTYNGSVVKLYRNGVVTASASGSGVISNNAARILSIGAEANGAAGRFWNGSIDQVRIYGAAIPASQIKEQYYVGLNRLLAKGEINKKEYFDEIR